MLTANAFRKREDERSYAGEVMTAAMADRRSGAGLRRRRPGRLGFLPAALLPALLLLVVFMAGGSAFGKDSFPRPRGAVNDFAGVIAPEYRQQMESLAREVWQKTGTAIVAVTMTAIEGEEINDYVNRLYQAWGIGRKGEDKGVLLFVTVKERKMRIETGYGVEGILPDGLVGEIRDKYMLPFFRKNEFGKGLSNGMIAVAAVVAKNAGVTLTGNPVIEPPRVSPQRAKKSGFDLWTIVVVAIVVILLLGTRQGRELLPWLIVLAMNRGGGGGGSGGGDFGGFGGGFGGFGGGSSGGGGAGGDF